MSRDPVEAQKRVLRKQREAQALLFKGYDAFVTAWVAGTAVPAPSLSQMEKLLRDLNENEKTQKSLYMDLFVLCKGAEFATSHEARFEAVFRDLTAAINNLTDLIFKHKTTTAPPLPSSVKLEPLKVPTFSGRFEEWQAFHDQFQSMIHNRTNLSGSEKLTYLQNALKGTATSVIAAYEPTDANYLHAWDHLKARYSVKREIIFSHIKQYEEFKPRHQESDFGLRSIADSVNKCLRTLTVQGVPVNQWDIILIYMALKKMDPESRKQWSLDLTTDIPTMDEFLKFLEKRAVALITSSHQTQQQGSNKAKSTHSHHAAQNKKTPSKPCIKCGELHLLFQCSAFRDMTVQQRKELVKNKLCQNCLSPNHTSNCQSAKSCYKCGQRHNTLLHTDPAPSSAPTAPQESVPPQPQPAKHSGHCAPNQYQEQVVILGTLLVNVADSHGNLQQCRVFVDPGSEVHFISEHCLTRLGLKRRKINAPIKGIGNCAGPVCKSQVSFTLESRTETFSLNLTANVLPKFAGLIPRVHCQSTWPHLVGLQLSDPDYHRAHYTDILLGGAKSGHIMLPQCVSDPSNSDAPVALNTRFGWMINGESPRLTHSSHHSSLGIYHAAYAEDLSSDLTRFWEQEEPETQTTLLSSSDVDCEEHFLKTHSVNPDGTYTVELPFRSGCKSLGNSREAAVKRLTKVEQRLTHQPQIKEEYVKNIREYLDLGYLEPVPAEDMKKPSSCVFYMPHREVVKESSSTTKVRIVFDASAKTSSGVSLNDVLHTGPKLQVDLFPLLLRFMSHQIAISADIWKFYPQTSVHPSHRDFQRLVWRESPDQPLQDLRMTRVTFGVSPAPFLAIRALHELANSVQTTHPQAAQVIKKDYHVDNLMSGGPALTKCVDLKDQILEVMDLGNLKLLKWISNSEEFMETISPELRDPSSSLSIDEGEYVKTIGILWNPRSDTFSVQISLPATPTVNTKRTVLSTIARTFDPLGWLSLFTILSKILLQDLWRDHPGWDVALPFQLYQQWRKYCEELPILQDYSLARCAFSPPSTSSTHFTHQLHGFSDGSDLAHAACVYVRTEDSDGNVSCKLLTAKTRVNPIQKATTPRSELCGAVLLTNLLTTVQASVDVKFTSVHCWTDSTVVLGRISPDKQLPIFELNRIRKILKVLPPHH